MPETSNALIDQLVYIDNFINTAAEETPNLDVDSQLLLDLAAFADDSFVFPDEDKPKHEGDLNDHDNTPFHHELALGLGAFNDNGADSDEAWFSQSARQHRRSFREKEASGLVVNERTKLAKRNRLQHHSHSQPPETKAPILPSQASHQATPAEHVEDENANQNNSLLNESQQDLSNLPKFPVPPGAKSTLKNAGLSLYQIDLLSALIAQHQGNLTHEHADPFQTQDRLLQGLDHANLLGIAPNMAYHSNVATPGSVASAFDSESSSVLATPSILSTGDFGPSEGKSADRGGELNKRKRNTAASARFRIKKKLKEKEMATKILLLQDLIQNFELKIGELEMENRLLKNLIIEKGNRNSEEELLSLKEKIKRQ